MDVYKLLETVESLKDKYVSFLKEVVEIEDPTDYKEGVDKVGEYFINKAKELGFKTEVFRQDVSGNVVVITMNSSLGTAPFCLSAHMDTVHKIGYFGNPCVTFEGDKMIGPGVCDDKSGCVAGFWAMEALKIMGYDKRPVMLLLQSDEETSSKQSNKATINYICERAKDAVGFLNLEPCYTGNGVTLKRKGICKLKFTVKGIAEHGATCMDGANALAEAAYKIIELEKYKDRDNITMSCDVITAGKAVNTVPDQCVFYVDTRFKNEEQYATIKSVAKEISEKVHIKGTSCVVEELSYRPSMPLSQKNVDFFNWINRLFNSLNMEELVENNSLGGSDAAYVTQRDIPVIDSIGPIGDHAHKREEYVDLSKFSVSPKRIAAIIANI